MTAESDDGEMTEDRVKEEVEGGSYGFWLLLFLEEKKVAGSFMSNLTSFHPRMCDMGSANKVVLKSIFRDFQHG